MTPVHNWDTHEYPFFVKQKKYCIEEGTQFNDYKDTYNDYIQYKEQNSAIRGAKKIIKDFNGDTHKTVLFLSYKAENWNTMDNIYKAAWKSSSLFDRMDAIIAVAILLLALNIGKAFYRKKKKVEESKRAFISAAAHELKTPIAVIQNQSELILEGINPEKTNEYVSSMHEEAKRMAELVNAIQQYDRLDDKAGITKETLDSDFFQANAKTMIPEERYGNEGELDTAAIFLASPASSYVTGVQLPVDGGYTCM